MLVDSANGDVRASHRIKVDLVARMRRCGSTARLDVDLIDLSPQGFRCSTRSPMEPGTKLLLTLPGLAALEAVVVWSEGAQRGCTFAQPLHIAVFQHVAHMFR